MSDANAQPEGYDAVWSELPTLLFIPLSRDLAAARAVRTRAV